jgi:hypothetical protein
MDPVLGLAARADAEGLLCAAPFVLYKQMLVIYDDAFKSS